MGLPRFGRGHQIILTFDVLLKNGLLAKHMYLRVLAHPHPRI